MTYTITDLERLLTRRGMPSSRLDSDSVFVACKSKVYQDQLQYLIALKSLAGYGVKSEYIKNGFKVWIKED